VVVISGCGGGGSKTATRHSSYHFATTLRYYITTYKRHTRHHTTYPHSMTPRQRSATAERSLHTRGDKLASPELSTQRESAKKTNNNKRRTHQNTARGHPTHWDNLLEGDSAKKETWTQGKGQHHSHPRTDTVQCDRRQQGGDTQSRTAKTHPGQSTGATLPSTTGQTLNGKRNIVTRNLGRHHAARKEFRSSRDRVPWEHARHRQRNSKRAGKEKWAASDQEKQRPKHRTLNRQGSREHSTPRQKREPERRATRTHNTETQQATEVRGGNHYARASLPERDADKSTDLEAHKRRRREATPIEWEEGRSQQERKEQRKRRPDGRTAWPPQKTHT